jgi:hypothetical protein
MEAQVYNEVLVARIHAQDAGHLGQGRAQQKSLPEKVNELIEAYFPTCRRSELNARAPLERPEARGGLRGRDLLAITDLPVTNAAQPPMLSVGSNTTRSPRPPRVIGTTVPRNDFRSRR